MDFTCRYISEAYSEPCQTSKIERFTKNSPENAVSYMFNRDLNTPLHLTKMTYYQIVKYQMG